MIKIKNIIKRIELYYYHYNFKITWLKEKLCSNIYHGGVKLLWYKLWIRKDEFHKSLDMDIETMIGMSEKRKNKYLEDLTRRRQIAHLRDINDN